MSEVVLMVFILFVFYCNAQFTGVFFRVRCTTNRLKIRTTIN